MMLGKIVFDHRPPLALRGEGENANDPDRLVAVCRTCNQRKTPRDVREIARTKRLALDHQDFINRMCDGTRPTSALEESMEQTGAQHRKSLGPIHTFATTPHARNRIDVD